MWNCLSAAKARSDWASFCFTPTGWPDRLTSPPLLLLRARGVWAWARDSWRCGALRPNSVWNSTQMPEWEYRKIDLGDLARNTSDLDLLDKAGEEGWELVVITSNNIAYFKRQIRKQSPRQKA